MSSSEEILCCCEDYWPPYDLDDVSQRSPLYKDGNALSATCFTLFRCHSWIYFSVPGSFFVLLLCWFKCYFFLDNHVCLFFLFFFSHFILQKLTQSSKPRRAIKLPSRDLRPLLLGIFILCLKHYQNCRRSWDSGRWANNKLVKQGESSNHDRPKKLE